MKCEWFRKNFGSKRYYLLFHKSFLPCAEEDCIESLVGAVRQTGLRTRNPSASILADGAELDTGLGQKEGGSGQGFPWGDTQREGQGEAREVPTTLFPGPTISPYALPANWNVMSVILLGGSGLWVWESEEVSAECWTPVSRPICKAHLPKSVHRKAEACCQLFRQERGLNGGSEAGSELNQRQGGLRWTKQECTEHTREKEEAGSGV